VKLFAKERNKMETTDVLLIPFVARSDFDLEMSIPTDQKEVQKKNKVQYVYLTKRSCQI